MEELSKKFIGRGWKFPVEFRKEDRSVCMLTGEEDIRNCLEIIFKTKMGERVMQPDFGSELDSFLFAQVTRSTITYMQAVISNAILFHEPRIVLNDVEIVQSDEDPERLEVNIDYTVSATNNRYNYVYPFYLKEATNLDR